MVNWVVGRNLKDSAYHRAALGRPTRGSEALGRGLLGPTATRARGGVGGELGLEP